jgi:hypothetical protein
LLGERLHGARALAKEIEQLEPLGRRDGFPEPSELLVDAVLELPMERRHSFKYSTKYLNNQPRPTTPIDDRFLLGRV